MARVTRLVAQDYELVLTNFAYQTSTLTVCLVFLQFSFTQMIMDQEISVSAIASFRSKLLFQGPISLHWIAFEKMFFAKVDTKHQYY